MTDPSAMQAPLDAVETGATYRPGLCNIGPEEIARRRRGAWVAGLATLVFYLGLLAIGAPDAVRFVVAVPAAGAAVSWLQARERFCVAFGSTGTYNFGPVGELEQVTDDDARRADRRKVASMIGRGVMIGIAIGVLAVLVP
jgi:uncharacterized membrane protein (DUF485 family)